MGLHHVGGRRSEESAAERAAGHGFGCAHGWSDLYRDEPDLYLCDAAEGDREERNHRARGGDGFVLATGRNVAVVDDRGVVFQRGRNLYTRGSARLYGDGAGWCLLQA